MSVLTESTLRNILRNKKVSEYVVEKGAIVTPSAKQYLSDKNIRLVIKGEEEEAPKASKEETKAEQKFMPKYEGINGGFYEEKPEYMTQLYGNKLVYKDNKRIIFRGKLDSLLAKILEAQVRLNLLKEKNALKDLEEVLIYVRDISECEILNKEFSKKILIGLNEDELRAYSHNPKKHLNCEHIFYPSYEMGEVVILFNSLRAQIREVEISALQCFKNAEGDISRADILRALNRLSSCLYIMMCKYTVGKYK